MMVGRFTADVTLTADFGTDVEPAAPASPMNDTIYPHGTISGDVTGFMADGETRDWDVNFESAMITMENDPDNNGSFADSALRFNGTASGHGDGGNATTGYWNGQFYGTVL